MGSPCRPINLHNPFKKAHLYPEFLNGMYWSIGRNILAVLIKNGIDCGELGAANEAYEADANPLTNIALMTELHRLNRSLIDLLSKVEVQRSIEEVQRSIAAALDALKSLP